MTKRAVNVIKIGVVNIDTAHPLMFSRYLMKGNRARYAAIYNDGFRGADEVEGIGGLMGTGAQTVRYLPAGHAGGRCMETYHITFSNGKAAMYNSLLGPAVSFNLVVVTTKASFVISPDKAKLYEPLLDRILDYMETGQNDMAKVEDIAESVKIMLVGKASKESGGIPVRLSDLD